MKRRLPPLLLLLAALAACESRPKKPDRPPLPKSLETDPAGHFAGGRATPPIPAVSLPPTAPDPPASRTAKALAPPTLRNAGAPVCKLSTPFDIATSPPSRGISVNSLPASIGFGPAGGLVLWQTEPAQGFARPLAADGHPTGPVQSFPTPGSLLVRKTFAIEGGFAVLASVFHVAGLRTSFWVIVLGPRGEPRGKPTPLDLGDHYFEDASDVVGDRFLVVGGPNQSKGLQGARVLLVRAHPSGEVTQKRMDFDVSAPLAVRPAVSFALELERWAVAVQVPGSGPQQVVINGKTYQTVPLIKTEKREPTQALIVDGKQVTIRGGTAAGGPLSHVGRYQLAWSGDELAVGWASGDSPAPLRYGRLSRDGTLRPAPSAPHLADRVELNYASGAGSTTVTRQSPFGAAIGQPTRLDGALPDVGGDMLELQHAWSGDRFVIAYAPKVGGERRLRTVGLLCR